MLSPKVERDCWVMLVVVMLVLRKSHVHSRGESRRRGWGLGVGLVVVVRNGSQGEQCRLLCLVPQVHEAPPLRLRRGNLYRASNRQEKR